MARIQRTYNYKDKEVYADKPEGTSHNVYDNSNVPVEEYTPDVNLDIFGYLEQLRKANIPLQNNTSIIKILEDAAFTAPQKKGDVISTETVQKIIDYLAILQNSRIISDPIAESVTVPTKDESLLEGGIFNKDIIATTQDNTTIYTDNSTSTKDDGGESNGSIYSDWIKIIHKVNILTANAGHTTYRGAYKPATNTANYATDCPTWKTSVNNGYKGSVKSVYNISVNSIYNGSSQGNCANVEPCNTINKTNNSTNKSSIKTSNKAVVNNTNKSALLQ